MSDREPLPAAPAARGHYVPAAVHGGFAFSAGMTPRVDGVLVARGVVGVDLTESEAQRAASIAARNALAAIADAVGGVHRIRRCLRLVVYVACSQQFENHSLVADGASDALSEYLDDQTPPVRTTIGVRSLPGGSAVEVELTVAIDG